MKKGSSTCRDGFYYCKKCKRCHNVHMWIGQAHFPHMGVSKTNKYMVEYVKKRC